MAVLLQCDTSLSLSRGPMSPLGHKRIFSDVETMSALPPKADIAEYDLMSALSPFLQKKKKLLR